MDWKQLNIDVAVEELLQASAEKKADYPEDHKAAMRVPKGGSSCRTCEYLADNKTDCRNKYFQEWNGSPVIPAPIDEYCSDWYEPKKDLQAARKLEGRTTFRGLNISIENDKGSTRKGVDKDGTPWETTMTYPYGYIRKTEGVDGDHVDCFLGPNEDAENVYVIHTNDPSTGKYDEDKCFLGFDSREDAKKAFLENYDDPKFFGEMDEIPFDDFKNKVLDTKDDPEKIEAYGTSEGVTKEWDERGRGRKVHPWQKQATEKFGIAHIGDKSRLSGFIFPDGASVAGKTHGQILAWSLGNGQITERDFMNKTGAVRVFTSPDSVNFQLEEGKPTDAQLDEMRNLAEGTENEIVYWDTPTGSGKGSFDEFENFLNSKEAKHAPGYDPSFHKSGLEAGGVGSGPRAPCPQCGKHHGGDYHHDGVSVEVFDRANRPNPNAASIKTFLHNEPPPMDERAHIANAFKQAVKIETTDVSIQSLTPLQNTVFKKKLEAITTAGLYRNPVDVFRYQGKSYILDGHHRVVAAVVDGKNDISANIFELKPKGLNAEFDVYAAINELLSGGPGSGCNPDVGKCGRPGGDTQSDDSNFDEQAAYAEKDAVEEWMVHPGLIRPEIENIIVNGMKPDIHTPAGALLDAIRNGDTFKDSLWRGVHAHSPEDIQRVDSFKKMTPGTEFQMLMPQSFTTDGEIAKTFMSYTKEPNGRLLFQVESGARGLNLAKVDSEYSGILQEKEVLTNGRFQVSAPPEVGKSKDGIPFTIVHVKHLGVM